MRSKTYKAQGKFQTTMNHQTHVKEQKGKKNREQKNNDI